VKPTIYKKLMLGFSVVIALMVLASTYVLLELQRVSDTTRSTITVDVLAIDVAKQMRTILYEEERYAQKFLIARDTAYHAVFTDNNRLFVTYLDSIGSMLTDPGDRRILLRVGRSHDWHFNAVSAADPLDPAASEKARTDTIDAILHSLDNLILAKQRSVSATVESVDTAARRSLRVALGILGGTLIAAIGTALVIARTITRPIRLLVAGTRQVAKGTFARIKVSSTDEIGDLAAAFNSMSGSLDALNRFRAEMMQHISHELRMPLQTMHSAYYLLTKEQEGPLNEQQKRLLGFIRENIDKIAMFSNQFLDLSKVEAGMMEYNIKPYDLAAVVRREVDDAVLIAEGKKISLTFAAAPAPEVLIDLDKTSQVVSNLLSNALKYTDAGGKVDVAVGATSRGAFFSVRDTGPGIPPEELPKIFKKFYRATHAVRGQKKGTGIGLAFVKAVVEGLGGTVRATSTVGVGSLFTVEFLPAPVTETKRAS
jgi:signal transduction histidine kinase